MLNSGFVHVDNQRSTAFGCRAGHCGESAFHLPHYRCLITAQSQFLAGASYAEGP